MNREFPGCISNSLLWLLSVIRCLLSVSVPQVFQVILLVYVVHKPNDDTHGNRITRKINNIT